MLYINYPYTKEPMNKLLILNVLVGMSVDEDVYCLVTEGQWHLLKALFLRAICRKHIFYLDFSFVVSGTIIKWQMCVIVRMVWCMEIMNVLSSTHVQLQLFIIPSFLSTILLESQISSEPIVC